MKLVVCETVAAIVLHLREDDGNRKPGGGLDTSLMLCGGGGSHTGWDTKIPPPESPAAARAVVQRPRYCSSCVAAWEALL